jgi:hypothetical protein
MALSPSEYMATTGFVEEVDNLSFNGGTHDDPDKTIRRPLGDKRRIYE